MTVSCTHQTPLTFVLQVLLARLCRGHHVSCHFVHVARSVLEFCQLLAVAICLNLRAPESVV